MTTFNRTEFKGKVIGMVLGDGHLTKADKRTMKNHSCLQISHSENQLAYLGRKEEALQELTSTRVSDRNYSKHRDSWFYTLRTKTHPLYTKLRNRFYYDGRKTVTEHLMKLLSVEGLAYWYLDDGSACGSVLLHTLDFNEAENQLMAYWLAKRFALHFKVNRDRNYFRLRLSSKDTDFFADTIKPYVPDCMSHKIPDHKEMKEYNKHCMRRHRRGQQAETKAC